ncbi:hypothetical protein BASA60_002068 [Batrachochytrium salamandrivorans]|nr:hypothetical protein BASA60_002068 [Batrachochytrium salamandrivorans]KAH9275784.1 hypothetical protein BASA83_001586 [Batrachochytrium salamandrivorans]
MAYQQQQQYPPQGQYPQQPGMQPYYAAQPKKAEFTHGLFDCCSDMGTCCVSCFCPCITYGQNQQRSEGKDGCCFDAFLYCLAGSVGLYACCGCYGRSRVRVSTNIVNESSVSDCLTHLCCASCALTQEKRELDAVGK